MGDSRMVSDQQRDSEQGVREVSSALFNRVTNYHAQIGANVNKETLQSLEWQVGSPLVDPRRSPLSLPLRHHLLLHNHHHHHHLLLLHRHRPPTIATALSSTSRQLLSEAKALFHRKEYEESLNTFTHCLAVTEKTRSSRDATVRGEPSCGLGAHLVEPTSHVV